MRVPYHIGGPEKDPNLENYPYVYQGVYCSMVVCSYRGALRDGFACCADSCLVTFKAQSLNTDGDREGSGLRM